MRSVAALLWRAAIRPRLLQPREAILPVLSVALGVSVFLAITIANRGAAGSFHAAFEMVSGRADLEIRGRIPDRILPEVTRCAGVAAATPLVEAMATLPDFPGESLRLIGIDPFTGTDLLTMSPASGDSGGDLQSWLGDDAALTIPGEFARSHGLRLGDTLRVQGPGAPRTMTVRGILPEGRGITGTARVAAIDIAPAQEWIGRPGEITAILIRLGNPKERDAVAAALRRLVPGDVQVAPPSARTRQVETMLAAFRLNLTALSLVSLMVGMFFVGNAAAAAVVRRRVSLGILRAVGAGKGFLTALVLGDAALAGCAGSLVGIAASPLLAGVMAMPVAKTVSALYLPADPHGGWPSPGEALAGFAAGVLSSVIAAWIPARQASGVDPVRVLHPASAPEIFPVRVVPLAALGLLLIGASGLAGLGALSGFSPLFGFLASFLVLAGFSLMVPLVMRMAGVAVRRLPLPVLSRVAVDQNLRSLHRTAPTVAALSAAAAMTVGIGVMIHSFRQSVESWAARTLTADEFLAPASNETLGLEHTLSPAMADWWRGRPEVRSVGTFREYEAFTPSGEQVTLGAVSGGSRGEIDFLHGNAAEKSAMIERGEAVALSESLARRLALGPQSRLVLKSPGGPVSLPVVDIYRDYTRDRGIAMIGAGRLAAVWGPRDAHSLTLLFRPGTTPGERERVTSEFCRAFGGREAFLIYDQAGLRARILEIFNQTFAVTSVLKTIAIAVAVGGVILTLGMLVMERSRDIGVLRSLGCSRPQIRRIMLMESGLMGLCAGVVGLCAGLALAVVLTRVINTVFFGWTIRLAMPWRELVILPLWMTAACLVAGWFPALRAARISPAEAVRME